MSEEGANASGNGNAKNAALAKLLNQLNIPTLVLILLTGGGNFFQGVQLGQEGHEERDRALREIHQLYGRISDFEDRQQKSLDNQKEIIKSNTEQVKNQTELLKSQQELLQLMHKTQQRFLNDKAFKDDQTPPF
jgi:hypothetical protein